MTTSEKDHDKHPPCRNCGGITDGRYHSYDSAFRDTYAFKIFYFCEPCWVKIYGKD